MSQPLNRALHRRLRRCFGEVKICNEGEAMVWTIARNTLQRGKDDEEPAKSVVAVEHAGEYYRVNCFVCRDTRFRMYVNHMFGQSDGVGGRFYWAAICYNEGCLASRENFKDFRDKLDDLDFRDARVEPGKVLPEEAREVLPPGRCSLLSELPKNHIARAYIQSRFFDPDFLASQYQVAYCHESRYSLARDRIIFPVYEYGKLKGWQARYTGELDWKGPHRSELPPKYFSCPDSHFRSRCIYQLERMAEWETGVLVEGPTDAINFGSMAGCIFGNSVTSVQKKKFLSHFRKRTGVLLLDPEEFESKQTKAAIDFFRTAMPGTFCAVKLPDGFDPGKLDREWMKGYVKSAAAEQGVKVRWRKISA